MIEFRDQQAAALGLKLIVHSNTKALDAGANPFRLGTERCCGLLKTQALLDALRAGGFDAAFGGARRDEEKSRAKERIFSFRDSFGQWDPKNQRPELWNLFSSRLNPGESIRVFPLSNWTEMDVWQYIHLENIPIVPLYYAKERRMLVRGNSLTLPEQDFVPPGRWRLSAAACVLSAARPAPARSAPMPTRFRRSSPNWSRCAIPSAKIALSIMTAKAPWK